MPSALTRTNGGSEKKRKNIEAHRTGSETDLRIKQALEIMENSASTITAWEESTIRQLVDWVKILSAEEILVCLHGGIEIKQRIQEGHYSSLKE